MKLKLMFVAAGIVVLQKIRPDGCLVDDNDLEKA
jgi:hypothetical protein